jgi:hypothetical protein
VSPGLSLELRQQMSRTLRWTRDVALKLPRLIAQVVIHQALRRFLRGSACQDPEEVEERGRGHLSLPYLQ